MASPSLSLWQAGSEDLQRGEPPETGMREARGLVQRSLKGVVEFFCPGNPLCRFDSSQQIPIALTRKLLYRQPAQDFNRDSQAAVTETRICQG